LTQQPKRTGRERGREARLYKALSHPLRFRILTKLNERPASPSELAVELDEKVGNVAYHVRTLLDLETVELVRTEQVRGTLEHFYRATERPFVDDDHWARLPLSIRRQFADSILQELWEHVVDATERDGFDGSDPHVSWTVLDLDGEGHSEVTRILGQALEDVRAAHAASAERERNRAPADRQSKRNELALMYYARPRSGEEG
jgi:DNA-binding transcriptional ArsR family regulator